MSADLWALLQSESTHERLRAARRLEKEAVAADRERIASARARESVPWICAALDRALRRASGGLSAEQVETTAWDDAPPDDVAYARAVEDTTRRLLHELRPIVGLLRVVAEREISDYKASSTRVHLERLADLLRAIATLGKAASPPQITRFDLADCLLCIAQAARDYDALPVLLDGTQPLYALGDRALVDLVIANALRNAHESERSTGVPQPVVLAWGETDREYWIAVLDRGVGLPPSADKAFDIGATTKKAHMGMGLAIAQRAAQSLLGQVTLAPRDGGGVSCELRWPRDWSADS